MPEAAKGPRLWLRRERRDKSGAVTHKAMWFIRDDGRYQQSTGCGIDDRERAVQLLAEYIAQKRLDRTRGARDPASVPVADVIARYVRDVAAKSARPKEAAQRARALLAYFGDKTLADINGDCCRRYAEQRSTDAAARRELEDLRAAINHHRREGLCSQVVEVVLPSERPARERWLTRSEAARLLGSDVTPHVLRHTAATWLMQSGVDIWEAAGFVGMTVEMLSQRYGHHHPAHLERAKNSFSAANRHTNRHTLPATKEEQTFSNVPKIAAISRTAK